MRIPVIQKPAINARSRDSGARPMNVQANAAPFMAQGQAISEIGQQISRSAQAFGDIQRQIITDEENAAAQTALQSEISKARTAVQGFNDPAKAEAEFQRLVKPKLKSITSGGYKTSDGSVLSFTTGSSRRAFNRTASALMTDGVATVRQVSRKRQVSTHISRTQTGITDAVKDIASMPPGLLRDIAIDLRIKRPLQNLENIGYLNAEQRRKEELKNIQGLARLQVEKVLAGAATPENARQIFKDINAGKYSDLSATAAQDLSERSQRLEQTLEIKSNRDRDRQRKVNRQTREDNQRKKYFEFYNRVTIDEAERAAGKTELKAEEVEEAYGNSLIDGKHRTRLISAIENKGVPIAEPKALVSQYTVDIRDAEKKEDMDKILDNVWGDRSLEIDTKKTLQAFAEQELSKTPQVKQEKLFRNVLANLAKPNSIIDKLLPGSRQKAEAILASYDAEIIDNGDPLDAFQRAVDSLSEGKKASLTALPKPRFGLPDKPLKAYTAEDVRTVRQVTKKRLKGKTSSLALELIYLETLEKYIEDPKTEAERTKALELYKETLRANELQQ
tara:strand:+ start:1669 stop:3351 length:1683 start_codon:yes stop_codon:yes gene_type:complete